MVLIVADIALLLLLLLIPLLPLTTAATEATGIGMGGTAAILTSVTLTPFCGPLSQIKELPNKTNRGTTMMQFILHPKLQMLRFRSGGGTQTEKNTNQHPPHTVLTLVAEITHFLVGAAAAQ